MGKQPANIYDLLDYDNFRKRTHFYIGENKIAALEAFMLGYAYCARTHGIEVKDTVGFHEFPAWVADHYGWKEAMGGWRRHVILTECKGDEEKALSTFFELYDKFKGR